MGSTREVITGLGWVGSVRFFARAVVFLKILYVYRLLGPTDVGLFGLVTITLGLLEMLTETGINIVIVNDKRPLSYFLDTAFVVSLARGAMISTFIALLAFILPWFFQEPSLQSLLLIAACIPLLRGAINPAVAKYQKELQFRQDAMIRLLPTFLDVLFAVLAVTLTHSAFGLVIGMVLAAATEMVITQVCITPRPRFAFNAAVFRDILHPGKWLNLASIFAYIEQNIDNFLVGKFLGTTALGYYQSAFNLSRSLIAEVGVTYAQVTLPLYGRLTKQSVGAKKIMLGISLSAGVLMLIPVTLLNLPAVQEVLLSLLQEKWRPVFTLIPYLSVAGWLTGMNLVMNPIMIVSNKFKTITALYAITAALLTVSLLVGITTFGLPGAAMAVLVTRILVQPLFIWRTLHAARTQS